LIVVLMPATALILCYYGLYLKWPEQGSLLDDWFVFIFSITLYFLGFFFADLGSFFDTCERHRKLFLAIALVCTGAQFFSLLGASRMAKTGESGIHLLVWGPQWAAGMDYHSNHSWICKTSS